MGRLASLMARHSSRWDLAGTRFRSAVDERAKRQANQAARSSRGRAEKPDLRRTASNGRESSVRCWVRSAAVVAGAVGAAAVEWDGMEAWGGLEEAREGGLPRC